MAKRLFDTGLVSQTWYQDLSPKGKALYVHLLCICDVAGVFETNYRMMSAYIGEKITEADVFDSFGRRVIPLTNHESKGMLVDFIGFQCGGILNPRVKVHASILKRLKELGVILVHGTYLHNLSRTFFRATFVFPFVKGHGLRIRYVY